MPAPELSSLTGTRRDVLVVTTVSLIMTRPCLSLSLLSLLTLRISLLMSGASTVFLLFDLFGPGDGGPEALGLNGFAEVGGPDAP